MDPNYSGWRGLDGARQQELREEVESGRYGMNILGLPQLLKDDSNTALLDPAGRMLVGDGLQALPRVRTVLVLRLRCETERERERGEEARRPAGHEHPANPEERVD